VDVVTVEDVFANVPLTLRVQHLYFALPSAPIPSRSGYAGEKKLRIKSPVRGWRNNLMTFGMEANMVRITVAK
jgi:hypothetical protein